MSYANGIMAQNLLSGVKVEPVISTIQEARAGADGEVFTVVGTVANGTAESGNAFFNTIYIQDEEGNGINVFPIDDSNIRRGDQVQVTGSVSEYIGDKQLSAINVTVLEGSKEVVITDTTTKEANDYAANFGKLVRVEGEATAVTMAGGIVESITVQDDSGEACRGIPRRIYRILRRDFTGSGRVCKRRGVHQRCGIRISRRGGQPSESPGTAPRSFRQKRAKSRRRQHMR